MNEVQNRTRSRVILWIGVIAIFLSAGLCLYQGSESLDLHAPKLSPSLENTVDEIKRLDTEYAEAIRHKAGFRDMWSLIAVVTAVLTAAAVALRAPQPFVIMPGAFIALIYGAIELQSPQTIVSALAKARGSLSCVESPVRELVSVKNMHLDEIDGLVERLEHNSETLKTYLVTLGTFHRRLTDVLQVKSESRHKATAAIDNGLMVPVEDNNLAIDAIKGYLGKLGSLENYVLSEINIKKDPHSLQMQKSLKELRSVLENALNHLESPAALKKKLRSGLNAYLEQLVRSTDMLGKADDQLKKTLFVSSKTEPTIIALKKWPKQIELVSASANKAVRDIHSTLLLEIAQAGSTSAQLALVLEAISPRMAYTPELAEHVQTFQEQSSAKAATVSHPLHILPNLAQEISSFESAVKETLKRFASDIASGRKKAAQFQKIINTSLVVLMQATELFEDATQMLESTINSYSTYLSDSLNALQKSEQILEQVNLIDLKSKIESCLSASPKI